VVKPAPAVVRAARLLDVFAARPRGVFSLTQLANAIDVSLPSALAILEALSRQGYVVRDPKQKTYRLGPALVAVGQAALVSHPAIEAAQQEATLLAREVSAECVGSMIGGDDIVFVATAGRPRSEAMPVRVGTRVPYRPPFGLAFVAWADEPGQQAWLDRGDLSAAKRRRLRAALDRVRTRGYVLGGANEARARFMNATRALETDVASIEARADASAALGELLDLVIAANADGPDGTSTAISAPVFDGDGQVALALTIQGYASALADDVIDVVAARVRASAALITKEIFGLAP
jgi:DNA-binding IclR family transcriptional regulator